MSTYIIHYSERMLIDKDQPLGGRHRTCTARPYEFSGSLREAELDFRKHNPGVAIDDIYSAEELKR